MSRSSPFNCSVTVYRLVLSHPEWPRETRTKWEESPDFTKAVAKAKELGVEATIESQSEAALHEAGYEIKKIKTL
jgi:hypothetical protein